MASTRDFGAMASDSGSYYVSGAAGRTAMPTNQPPQHAVAPPPARVPQSATPSTRNASGTQRATLVISICALVFSIIAAASATYTAYVVYQVIEGLKQAFQRQ